MPKNVFTPREELICGKLDVAEKIAIELKSVELVELLQYIRKDAIRMEAKLILRKQEVRELLNKNKTEQDGK